MQTCEAANQSGLKITINFEYDGMFIADLTPLTPLIMRKKKKKNRCSSDQEEETTIRSSFGLVTVSVLL